MQQRALGQQGLRVSAIGMGCMSLTGAYAATATEEEGGILLRRAAELGVTFFDTAEIYGPFTNEKIVGKYLNPIRDDVVIATKFGFHIPEGSTIPAGVNSHPDNIRKVCDASLQRLGIDTIDLFYQHRVDPKVPIEDVAGTVAELIAAGKVRYFGLSEAGVDSIRRAHAVHPVSALQSEYSLWSRAPERDVLPLCRELGIGFVPYSPLGRGFLAGSGQDLSDRDFRRNMPRWQGEALTANLPLAEALRALAEARGHTPAQMAIAWLLRQGEDIVPIPGTSKLHRLEENIAAAAVTLSDEDIRAIEAAVPEHAIVGERYDERGMAMVNI